MWSFQYTSKGHLNTPRGLFFGGGDVYGRASHEGPFFKGMETKIVSPVLSHWNFEFNHDKVPTPIAIHI
jgi:hypothetical protein